MTLLGEKDSHEEMFEASLTTRDQLVRLAQQAGCSCECVYLTVQYPTPLANLDP